MKKLLSLFSVLFLFNAIGFSQDVQSVKKMSPLKGTFLKSGKLFISKGYKGQQLGDGKVVIMKMANNGGSGAISGTYICSCKSMKPDGADDCKTLVSGDMLDCFSKNGKCVQCLLMVTTENALALQAGKKIEWAILETGQ